MKNNLPDVLARWSRRDGSEADRPAPTRASVVPKADIVAQNYDLSLNRYKEIIHEEVEHRSLSKSSPTWNLLEAEIQSGLSTSEGGLGMTRLSTLG